MFNKIKSKKYLFFNNSFIFLILVFFPQRILKLLNNIQSNNLLLDEYPLYNFYLNNSDLIDENVLALDHPLLLYYFNSQI